MKNKLFEAVENNKSILIAGHMHPDGDCIGACLALGQYIKSNYKDKDIDIYLENIPDVYDYLSGQELIRTSLEDKAYDLFIALDCGDKMRLGEAVQLFDKASSTFNIDHHISNPAFAEMNVVALEASSTCEIIYELLNPVFINKQIAEALYTGIIFDTGIFKHSSTTKRTLEIAGELIEYNFNFSSIIDRVFFEKTYGQNQLLGKALLNSQLALDDRCIYSFITQKDLEENLKASKDTDGIIDQLRVTQGVLMAFFLYEDAPNHYKMSLRANDKINVCTVAQYFGGGGHTKASGCSVDGELEDIIQKVIELVDQQLH
jgi:phosphoesterase RecJ-like protein